MPDLMRLLAAVFARTMICGGGRARKRVLRAARFVLLFGSREGST